MHAKRLAALALLAVALFAGSGCIVSFITPQAANLRHVHDTYAQEFSVLMLPSPAAAGQPPATAPGPSPAGFPQTLRALHEYRRKYPGDAAILAHLKVLEGMIYLQSGRFGLAEAVKAEVAEAGGKLSSATGLMVRDQLFAQNFATLLDGWVETKKRNGRDWAQFERVADRLSAALTAIPAARLAEADADQGALYLATSAAIFYVWAYADFSFANGASPARQRELFGKGADIIGRFLTAAEKSPGAAADVADATSGRLRYLRWYHWLRGQTPA